MASKKTGKWAGEKVGKGEKGKGRKGERACRRCGCTYFSPCVDSVGMSCAWVAKDLCSACMTKAEKALVILPLHLRILSEQLTDAHSVTGNGLVRQAAQHLRSLSRKTYGALQSVLKGGRQ